MIGQYNATIMIPLIEEGVTIVDYDNFGAPIFSSTGTIEIKCSVDFKDTKVITAIAGGDDTQTAEIYLRIPLQQQLTPGQKYSLILDTSFTGETVKGDFYCKASPISRFQLEKIFGNSYEGFFKAIGGVHED